MNEMLLSGAGQLAPAPKVEKHYAVSEICQITGTREFFIRGEIKSGRLQAKNFGRAVRVAESDLADYLASRPERVANRKGSDRTIPLEIEKGARIVTHEPAARPPMPKGPSGTVNGYHNE